MRPGSVKESAAIANISFMYAHRIMHFVGHVYMVRLELIESSLSLREDGVLSWMGLQASNCIYVVFLLHVAEGSPTERLDT